MHGDLLLEELCVDPVRDPHLAPLQQSQDGHPARRPSGRVLGLQRVPGVPRRGTVRPRRPHALLPRAHPALHVALGPHRLGAQGVRCAGLEAGARSEPGGAGQVSSQISLIIQSPWRKCFYITLFKFFMGKGNEFSVVVMS